MNQVYCITTGTQESSQNDNENIQIFFATLCQTESLSNVIWSHSVPQISLGREVTP